MSSVIVCGSREWPAPWFVTAKMIELIPRDALVITGGARGVDRHAHLQAVRLKHPTRVMPADWSLGLGAGKARNIAMLDFLETQAAPIAVLAFALHHSHGTMHTVGEAAMREITTFLFTEHDLKP